MFEACMRYKAHESMWKCVRPKTALFQNFTRRRSPRGEDHPWRWYGGSNNVGIYSLSFYVARKCVIITRVELVLTCFVYLGYIWNLNSHYKNVLFSYSVRRAVNFNRNYVIDKTVFFYHFIFSLEKSKLTFRLATKSHKSIIAKMVKTKFDLFCSSFFLIIT